MAQVVVRKLDESLKSALKLRATAHGWSMEEEVRQILRVELSERPLARGNLGTRIAERFANEPLDEPLPEMRGETLI
ncbi:toxin-antitoxin system [Spiribacter sp. C176]|uniref:Toxin-antitoxin system n=1 Tax=Spiribacter salilacus TaxID=2664894 RepID=A0A6N7QR71_9GAMM|nr:toxin-antitoxin system [Spiribacter salilacus]MRH77913.1 toxin-antitoxin system [Spiribacter salilacus]